MNDAGPRPTSFRCEIGGGVATLRLDRPEALNALTFEVYEELTSVFTSLRERDDVRAIVLTGTGRAFCTGGDVRGIIGALLESARERDAEGLREFTRLTCDLVRAMRRAPQPVVAALNGTVAGAGAVLALASDFRIAAHGAKIAFLFVRVGLAGADMGAAYLLPRVVGLGRATELLMLGDFVTADDALRMGLYHRVVPPEDLEEETRRWVERLTHGPARALAATKDALNRELLPDLDAALDHEAEVQARLMQEPDFREGYAAFLEKRAPRFAGAPE